MGQHAELRRTAAEYALTDDHLAPDDAFFTDQSARLVRNAERYCRAMFGSGRMTPTSATRGRPVWAPGAS